MLPLYDENPTRRRPVLIWLLIAANVFAFVWELGVTGGFTDYLSTLRLFLEYGSTPRIIVSSIPTLSLEPLSTLLTSMFLHGGYMHILGNMVYLYIFGDNVEDRFGRLPFLASYLLFGVVGGLVHSYVSVASEGVSQCTASMIGSAASCTPAVGASGAVSGVLGAYIVLFPRARVITVAFLWYFIRLLRVPAYFYLGFWFLLQLLYGAAGGAGNVAYWAHIGGFAIGVAAALAYKAASRSS